MPPSKRTSSSFSAFCIRLVFPLTPPNVILNLNWDHYSDHDIVWILSFTFQYLFWDLFSPDFFFFHFFGTMNGMDPVFTSWFLVANSNSGKPSSLLVSELLTSWDTFLWHMESTKRYRRVQKGTEGYQRLKKMIK